MECIVNQRLVWWLESQLQIGMFQFAYRKNHSTTQALTYFVDCIKKGFKDNKVTVAVMIDLEGAFDTVWRNGVLYKLWHLGIRGRMLLFIHSFLTQRFSRSFVYSHISEWSETHLGIPQGSLLSVILFILHISDMTKDIPMHIKFADDVNAWETHNNPTVATTRVQTSLDKILSWNIKWRLILSKDKTKVYLFHEKRPS